MADKALVIRDDKHKFRDVGDVLAVARSEGKKLFRTGENVEVVRIYFDAEVGWIAVVRRPDIEGRSSLSGVDRGEENGK